MVKLYELMVLLPSSFNQDQIKASIQAIEKLATAKKGKVESSESLGKRQLAYQINKQTDAYYVVCTISLDTAVAQSFERDIRLLDNVLRSLFLVKTEKKVKRVVKKAATIDAVQE